MFFILILYAFKSIEFKYLIEEAHKFLLIYLDFNKGKKNNK
jgi:hypothetical protein